MNKICPINKFLDCVKEKCAWWIYKPEIRGFDEAKGYEVTKREKIEGCAIKILVEKEYVSYLGDNL